MSRPRRPRAWISPPATRNGLRAWRLTTLPCSKRISLRAQGSGRFARDDGRAMRNGARHCCRAPLRRAWVLPVFGPAAGDPEIVPAALSILARPLRRRVGSSRLPGRPGVPRSLRRGSLGCPFAPIGCASVRLADLSGPKTLCVRPLASAVPCPSLRLPAPSLRKRPFGSVRVRHPAWRFVAGKPAPNPSGHRLSVRGPSWNDLPFALP